jgi:hypothetical protein
MKKATAPTIDVPDARPQYVQGNAHKLMMPNGAFVGK